MIRSALARRSMPFWAVALLAVVATLLPVSWANAAGSSFTLLQLSLCKGGTAQCPQGGADVDVVITTIRQRQPNVVTINDVCAGDVTRLAFETEYQPQFAPVARSGAPVRCPSGRGDLGIAILSHPDQGSAGKPVKKRFALQDNGNQERVLLCARYSKVSACTAYLSDIDAQVAAGQCRELTEVATRFGASTVIGADLNLTSRGKPDAQACVPGGWVHQDDGSLQHVFATSTFRLVLAENLPIPGTTHPGLLVGFSR